ncbi:MAG: hypothetical protein ACPGO3_04680 [Magnetospiraceae bacterium]
MADGVPPVPPVTTTNLLPQVPRLVSVGDPPPGLVKLLVGQGVTAQILAAAASGGRAAPQILSSPFGDFQIQPPLPLPPGTEIAFRLQALAPRVELLITAINGKPLPTAAGLAQSTAGGALRAVPQAAVTNAGRGGFDAAFTTRGADPIHTRGTVLTPTSAPQGGAAPGITAPGGATPSVSFPTPASVLLPPGSQWTIRLLAIQPPGPSPAAIASGSAPAPAAGAPAPSAAPPGPSIPQVAGAPVSSTSAPAAGSAGASTPSAPGPGTVVTGVVTAVGPRGAITVATPVGNFALDLGQSLPEGTGVRLQLVARLDGATPTTHTHTAPQGPSPAVGWPALEEALAAVRAAQPEVAHQVVNRFLPKPGASFTPTVLFLLAALKGGNLRGFLGDPFPRVLTREHPPLLTRLGDDFAQLAGRVADSAGNDWRFLMVPLALQERIDHVNLFYRRPPPVEGDEAEPGTRFVIDLDISLFGHLQFDGLAREKKRSLALILRSREPLPGKVRREIHDLYGEARGGLGLDGSLTFQGDGQFVDFGGAEITPMKLKDFLA